MHTDNLSHSLKITMLADKYFCLPLQRTILQTKITTYIGLHPYMYIYSYLLIYKCITKYYYHVEIIVDN